MSIAVVTDSTSDLPKDVAEDMMITVVPLNVHFGDETYKDNVTLKADEFYKKLQASKELPKTSQPSPAEFIAAFENLGKTHSHIISVHISSKVSGTFASALTAANEIKDKGSKVKVEVIDSGHACMGLGLVAMETAKTINGGASFEESVEIARSAGKRVRFLGLIKNLENLYKGGRIGKAQMLMGSLLNIKPMLEVVDGEAKALGRFRTVQKGFEELVNQAAASAPLEDAWALYTTERELAKSMTQRLAPLTKNKKAGLAQVGPVVGTYLGPGIVGIATISAKS